MRLALSHSRPLPGTSYPRRSSADGSGYSSGTSSRPTPCTYTCGRRAPSRRPAVPPSGPESSWARTEGVRGPFRELRVVVVLPRGIDRAGTDCGVEVIHIRLHGQYPRSRGLRRHGPYKAYRFLLRIPARLPPFREGPSEVFRRQNMFHSIRFARFGDLAAMNPFGR